MIVERGRRAQPGEGGVDVAIERTIEMPLGVVIERRESNSRWQKYAWMPVAVIPGAPPVESWRELRRGPDWVQYHAGTLRLELHRKETEAYRVNLSDAVPSIYVVLREDESADRDYAYRPFKATASPFEAQDYLDSDDIVERVPMDGGLIAWVQAFIDRHHVDEPFKKRKRKRYAVDEAGFGKPAPVDRPRAARRREGGEDG